MLPRRQPCNEALLSNCFLPGKTTSVYKRTRKKRGEDSMLLLSDWHSYRNAERLFSSRYSVKLTFFITGTVLSIYFLATSLAWSVSGTDGLPFKTNLDLPSFPFPSSARTREGFYQQHKTTPPERRRPASDGDIVCGENRLKNYIHVKFCQLVHSKHVSRKRFMYRSFNCPSCLSHTRPVFS